MMACRGKDVKSWVCLKWRSKTITISFIQAIVNWWGLLVDHNSESRQKNNRRSIFNSSYIYKCLTKCVVYKATVTETTSKNQETYIGLTENEFKTRFNLHKSSFKLEHKRTSTTLSDHVWKLKKKNINFNVSWQVVKRVKPFAPSNKVCGLCLQEKLSILRSAPSLNKRSEIFGHCIHRKKFLLSNLSMSTDEVSIADRNSESWQE